jgi:hypothetical protein
MRRENAENARRRQLFQRRMLESADLPVEQRKAFYEKAMSELLRPFPPDGDNRSLGELREENARLRAELSSRR